MTIHIFSPTTYILIHQESSEFDSVMSHNRKTKTEIQCSASNKELKVEITNFRYERHVFYRNSATLDQWKSRERPFYI